MGTERKNVDPCPTVLSPQSLPWCAWTMPFAVRGGMLGPEPAEAEVSGALRATWRSRVPGRPIHGCCWTHDDPAYVRARKRVEELRGFYTHLAMYLAVNLGLFILNMVTNPHARWFFWPLVGWGIGVLIHGLALFLGGPLSKKWEERKIDQLMEKERTKWRSQPPRPHAP
jgi:hypothetical protein